MNDRIKLVRITTVPTSLNLLIKGQPNFMQSKGYEVLLASSSGAEIRLIKEETGIEVTILPLTRQISPFTDLKALWLTYNFFRKEKPDIVHTHTPKAGLIGMLAGKFARVPIRMHTVAGLPLMEAKGIKRFVLDNVERLTSWGAHFVYPNSFAMRDYMENENLAPKQKLKIIANGSSNGINTDFFSKSKKTKGWQTRVELDIDKSAVVFCFVGRIVPDKGINELLQAYEKIYNKYENTKLLLVGPYEQELYPLNKDSINIIDRNPNIINVGWQKDVRPFLALSDVFVFPSYREGFPNVVMQAGAMDLPCIVSNINGCNEIIIEDMNGVIIPTKNSVALSESMELLINNTELRGKLASNSRQMIVERFSQKFVWSELLNEYNKLIKEAN